MPGARPPRPTRGVLEAGGELLARGICMVFLPSLLLSAFEPLQPNSSALLLIFLGGAVAVGTADALYRGVPKDTTLQAIARAAGEGSGLAWTLRLTGISHLVGFLFYLPFLLGRVLGVFDHRMVALVSEGALIAFLAVVVIVDLLMLGKLPELLVEPVFARLHEPPEPPTDPPQLPSG